MFTKTKQLIWGLLLAVILAPAVLFAQNDDDYDMSFSLYTNNMYASGQDITINVYAYYLKKGTEFNFKIYKINDIEGFFSRQTSNYQIDVLSRDSMNLLGMCTEIESFNKKLKVEGSDD